jgi:hypothetical protein
MSNQYTPKLETINGGYRVSLWDGDTEIVSTTPINPEYKLVADMLHSTLEVACAFGFLKKPAEHSN